jgi:hypothetical protein
MARRDPLNVLKAEERGRPANAAVRLMEERSMIRVKIWEQEDTRSIKQ